MSPTGSPFDTSIEIVATLLEADLLDSVGQPLGPDPAGGPVRRQGVSYQTSQFSEDSIVGWIIDVTSWPDETEADWVDHIDNLRATELPISLIVGRNWALTIRPGQPDSEIAPDLPEEVASLLPDGFLQWGVGQEAEWFEPKYNGVSEIVADLAEEGFAVTILPPDPGLNDYLLESLQDDTFAFISVSVPGGPAAVACILIEQNFARNAANALEGYLPKTGETTTIASDGWALRVVRWQSPEVDGDEYAEQLGSTLEATYTDSDFIDLENSPGQAIDTYNWGPQKDHMKRMLDWTSRHGFAVPQETWTDEREEAWERIGISLDEAGRTDAVNEARLLMSAISSNDFFDHTGREAIYTLGARDLISPSDYDLFTLPWRSKIGRIHPEDVEVPIVLRPDEEGALWSKFE